MNDLIIRWETAPDIETQLAELVNACNFNHIKLDRIICYRSYRSKARARARIWGLSRIWQQALQKPSFYIIEVISEKFDVLDESQKKKVLIHELLHIPKTFSGALVAHRGRFHRINSQTVEKYFARYKKKC